jgi:hypothetical protein
VTNYTTNQQTSVYISPIERAILKWRGYDARSSVTNKDYCEFGVFIGKPYDPFNLKDRRIINYDDPEVKRIVDMINGENGHTVLAVIKARQKS